MSSLRFVVVRGIEVDSAERLDDAEPLAALDVLDKAAVTTFFLVL